MYVHSELESVQAYIEGLVAQIEELESKLQDQAAYIRSLAQQVEALENDCEC
jgi:peptidoglycan hydrolase CwlO-like protein